MERLAFFHQVKAEVASNTDDRISKLQELAKQTKEDATASTARQERNKRIAVVQAENDAAIAQLKSKQQALKEAIEKLRQKSSSLRRQGNDLQAAKVEYRESKLAEDLRHTESTLGKLAKQGRLIKYMFR